MRGPYVWIYNEVVLCSKYWFLNLTEISTIYGHAHMMFECLLAMCCAAIYRRFTESQRTEWQVTSILALCSRPNGKGVVCFSDNLRAVFRHPRLHGPHQGHILLYFSGQLSYLSSYAACKISNIGRVVVHVMFRDWTEWVVARGCRCSSFSCLSICRPRHLQTQNSLELWSTRLLWYCLQSQALVVYRSNLHWSVL